MFINEAFATAAGAAAAGVDTGSFPKMILQFGVILFVFYLFLIRPQTKKMKEHQRMIAGVEKGNKVITQGGIIGKVIRVEEGEVVVEIADGVRIRVVKDRLHFVGDFEKSDKVMTAKASAVNSNDGDAKPAGKADKLKEILK